MRGLARLALMAASFPSWAASPEGFHLKPITEQAWINGEEFTTVEGLLNRPSSSTFARAYEQYGRNLDGTYTLFASGIPAITNMGVSIEPADTALARNSLRPDAWGSGSNIAKVDGVAGAVGNSASRITGNGVSGVHSISATNESLVSGTTYTMIVWVQDFVGSGCVQLIGSSAVFGSAAFANYDLAGNGAMGTIGGSCTAGIVKVGTGRFMLWMRSTATASSSGGVTVALVASTTSARNANSTSTASVTVSGRQISTNVAPGSPIATVASIPITRPAVVWTLKPRAGTFNITVKYGDGTADLVLSNQVIGGAGWVIPDGFISEVIGRRVS